MMVVYMWPLLVANNNTLVKRLPHIKTELLNISKKLKRVHFLRIEQIDKCNGLGDCSVSFMEHYWDRGKYTLSEKEYLWNHRMKGSLNVQKTLKS